MTFKHLISYLNYNHLTYREYMASDHWQNVRRRFWASKLHDRKCYACARRDVPLEVHHKTYRRIGHEMLQDLCLLCRECHQKTHDLVKAGLPLKSAAKDIRKANGVCMRGYKHAPSGTMKPSKQRHWKKKIKALIGK